MVRKSVAPDFQPIVESLRDATGESITRFSARPLSGGCINAAHALTDNDSGATWFIKINDPSRADMFAAEAEALAEIAATRTIRVPKPIARGIAPLGAWLALEYLDLSGPRTPENETAMGEQLAALHRIESTDGRFGWHRDNVIGSTPQPNPSTSDWLDFFREHRLGHQLTLASRHGRSFDRADDLLDRLPKFFSDYAPRPSLLHGDLWGGNASFEQDGTPILFDPASYYGDRETDLAFTEMFGGFGTPFYEAYEKAYPLDPGFSRRKNLYNLYHVLNHHNLFGGSYATQAQETIDDLLQAS